MRAEVRTDYYPYMLCIRESTIKMDKSLQVRPKDGIQVIFRFGISAKRDGVPQHFVGLADVWDAGHEDSGEEKELPSCVEIPDSRGQELHPKDFLEHWRVSRSDSSFFRVVEIFLGYERNGTMEALICDQLLYDFCKSYKPKVEIVPVGNPGQPTTAEVRVRFFRKRVEVYTYIFTLERTHAEKFFELP